MGVESPRLGQLVAVLFVVAAWLATSQATAAAGLIGGSADTVQSAGATIASAAPSVQPPAAQAVPQTAVVETAAVVSQAATPIQRTAAPVAGKVGAAVSARKLRPHHAVAPVRHDIRRLVTQARTGVAGASRILVAEVKGVGTAVAPVAPASVSPIAPAPRLAAGAFRVGSVSSVSARIAARPAVRRASAGAVPLSSVVRLVGRAATTRALAPVHVTRALPFRAPVPDAHGLGVAAAASGGSSTAAPASLAAPLPLGALTPFAALLDAPRSHVLLLRIERPD